MAVIGDLLNFSLPELLRLSEQGQKTGVLTLCDRAVPHRHFIWFYEGRVVAYVRDTQTVFLSLSDRLRRHSDLGSHALDKMQQLRPSSRPLGQWLQEQGLLRETQLQQLFREQVVLPIAELFTLSQGQFRFRPQTSLPLVEMTGLSIPASALVLAGFRRLEDWSLWRTQLPAEQALLQAVGTSSSVRLAPLESRLLSRANGRRSLAAIARQLGQPVTNLQKIAFSLQQIGLLEAPADLSPDFSGAVPNRWMLNWTDELSERVALPLSRGVQTLLHREVR